MSTVLRNLNVLEDELPIPPQNPKKRTPGTLHLRFDEIIEILVQFRFK
jgi:hypothetical protein